jgi:hypothetical protein
VLANHCSELKAVEVRHANIDQDDSNILLEEVLERLPGRSGLDEIFAEAGEYRLVAQQLRRLIIDQQDVDLVIRGHQFFISAAGMLLAFLIGCGLWAFAGAPPPIGDLGRNHCHRCSHMRSADNNCSVLTGFAR